MAEIEKFKILELSCIFVLVIFDVIDFVSSQTASECSKVDPIISLDEIVEDEIRH